MSKPRTLSSSSPLALPKPPPRQSSQHPLPPPTRSPAGCFWSPPPPEVEVGYDRKGVLRTGTGNRIYPNTIPVLITGTGIYLSSFRFRLIWNRNLKSLFRFRQNRNRKLDSTGFLAGFTGIHFPKKLFYRKSVY